MCGAALADQEWCVAWHDIRAGRAPLARRNVHLFSAALSLGVLTRPGFHPPVFLLCALAARVAPVATTAVHGLMSLLEAHADQPGLMAAVSKAMACIAQSSGRLAAR